MRITLTFVGVLLIAGHVWAQTPAQPARAPRAPQTAPAAPPAAPAVPGPVTAAPPPPPPPPPPAPREGQAINVRVELTISEDGGGTPPVKKTVSAVVGDGYNGFVREQSSATQALRPVPLNFDAMPVLLPNGKIRLTCSIQYHSGTAAQGSEPPVPTDIRQNLVLILESGKALVVSEATDPIRDRKVTVEVKATILR